MFRKKPVIDEAYARHMGWVLVEPEGCPFSPVYKGDRPVGRAGLGVWDGATVYKIDEIYYTLDEPHTTRKARLKRRGLSKLEEKEPIRTLDISRYDFATREGRARFIQEQESSMYDGFNVEGEYVLVLLDQGKGMAVWTIHHSKPRWFEVIYFGSDGKQEGVTYKPTARPEGG